MGAVPANDAAATATVADHVSCTGASAVADKGGPSIGVVLVGVGFSVW